ncbi:MAG TPA: outer membrane beta-barrel protein [Planctomycetota bacterium]|nr:outer membrane beta-barrel protein [Planctomycetota bacterium]
MKRVGCGGLVAGFVLFLGWPALAQEVVGNVPVAASEQDKKDGDKKPEVKKPEEKKPEEKKEEQAAPKHTFLKLLIDSIGEALDTPAYVPPDPKAPPADRRGNASPFDAPPFCTSEWQLGGGSLIGDPNSSQSRAAVLMPALFASEEGQAWKDSRFWIYGWVDASLNVSTSHSQGGNWPMAYDYRPNRAELNQATFYIDRYPDTFQTDHMDWGMRVTSIYGLDYRYTIMKGIFSDQLLKEQNSDFNRIPPTSHNIGAPGSVAVIPHVPSNGGEGVGEHMGYDIPMCYGELYVPGVAEGMVLRLGRYISLPDIEAQLASDNLMATHSLLYSYDPYTQVGLVSSIKLTRNWLIQTGISAGGDVAPWARDPGRQATGDVMIRWESTDNKDSVYAGPNQFNNAKCGYNNLQQYVATWTHKFDETYWFSWETWYMYMNGVVDPTGKTSRILNTHEWASVLYLEARISNNAFLSIRNELFNDSTGQRTTYATLYSEHAIGLSWWPNSMLQIRPEVRFEHSYDVNAYDNGQKNHQATFNIDFIVHW